MITKTTESVKIWDIFVRLFHWSLVVCIAAAWWTAEEGRMEWHKTLGFVILSLILFRLIWGVIGSRYARFSQFIYSPARTLHYLKSFIYNRAPHFVGHNPLGGWMVVALLLLCLLQGTTGLFATDDIFTTGPLYDYVSSDLADLLTSIHKALFSLIQLAVILHVAAVLYHQIFRKERLIEAMIHGCKRVAEQTPAARIRIISAIVACVCGAGLFLFLRSLS